MYQFLLNLKTAGSLQVEPMPCFLYHASAIMIKGHVNSSNFINFIVPFGLHTTEVGILSVIMIYNELIKSTTGMRN